MRKGAFDYLPHVVVCQCIKNVLAYLAICDKVALTKYFQLVRYSRFCHSEKGGDVTDAHRLSVYSKEYADSRGVTENLKKVGELVERTLLGHLSPSLLDKLGVRFLALTARNIIFVMLHTAPFVHERINS